MRRLKRYLLALGFVIAVTPQIIGQQLDTFIIDVPGATMTAAQGINARGDIVGQYISLGVTHGFLLSGGEFASIDVPGASSSFARGINARGDIVGLYTSGGVTHGTCSCGVGRREGHSEGQITRPVLSM